MFAPRQNLLLLACLGVMLCISLAELPEKDVIKEDVIEIANETQKVIRVKPVELPLKPDRTPGSHMNSELFQIQTLQRGEQRSRQRNYMDSKRMRPRPRISESSGEAMQPALKFSYTPELKASPKQKLKRKQQKQLHYPVESSPATATVEPLPVQMSPGPYPIYYVLSKTNGRFGKFPIKSFRSPAEFAKYLIKSKAEPIPRTQRFEAAVDPVKVIGSR
ncbi:uncharacterized protein LOC108655256 isoform X1 [Drosophila navojoa]|uniref:uncharacterized protein LOC108655256 isoform X1 n=1 Tax=Drosophila navojoa TaxID=7232 RepID=UPI0008463546|nr:uncharacterized protein LOC108655256 isoform X1 [Drosophila navojoa]